MLGSSARGEGSKSKTDGLLEGAHQRRNQFGKSTLSCTKNVSTLFSNDPQIQKQKVKTQHFLHEAQPNIL